MSSLNSGGSSVTQQNYIFPNEGMYWVRACADKSNHESLGGITEAVESDNCSSSWKQVYVGSVPVNGECNCTHFECATGTSIQQQTYINKWTWKCQGSPGGTTSELCSENRPITASGTLITLFPTCTIPEGGNSCDVNLVWSITNPSGIHPTITANNMTTITLTLPPSSGNKFTSLSYLNSPRVYNLENANKILASTPPISAVCGSGTVWNEINSKCVASSSGTLSATSCQIEKDQSDCTSILNWTTKNLTGDPAVTRNNPENTPISKEPQGVDVPDTVNHGSSTYFLYHMGLILSQTTITADCVGGTVWDVKENKCVEASVTTPVVETKTVTLISQNLAQSGGKIISNGGAEIIEKGIVWSTEVNPNISDNKKITPMVFVDDWGEVITGLTPSTLYHVRAYAINSVGISYGVDLSFTTLGVLPSGTLTATSCEIQLDKSTCTSILNWTTANLTDTPAVTRNNPDKTFISSQTNGTNVSNTVNHGDSTYFLYHKEIELANAPITAECVSGTTWSENKCIKAEGGLPDLVPSNLIPEAFPAGKDFNFSATVTNKGGSDTKSPFDNFFQISKNSNGAGAEYLGSQRIEENLRPQERRDISVSSGPLKNGSWYVQVCTDKRDYKDVGVIEESNEVNNCSPWRLLTIFDGSRDGQCSSPMRRWNCSVAEYMKIEGGDGSPIDPWKWHCFGFGEGSTATCKEVDPKYCNIENATNYNDVGPCVWENCKKDGAISEGETGVDCGGTNCPACKIKKPGYVEN
jgi:hypothetical protein